VPKTGKKHGGNTNIYLITFYGLAELSRISNFRDKLTKIVKVGKKAIKVSRRFNFPTESYTIHFIDLIGYFSGSLSSASEILDVAKIKISAGGKGHDYWISRMLELYNKYPKKFDEYALNDAVITLLLWNLVKQQGFKAGLDAHQRRTVTSLAMGEFRLKFMKSFPCKYRIERYPKIIGNDRTGYKIRRGQSTPVFAGDWNVRRYALRSYAGGNNQSFVRGYFTDLNAKFLDFVSLYITAALIQPLPNEFTKWKKLTLSDVSDFEGFAYVKFEFPESEKYPCLPIHLNLVEKLLFPRSGKSWCTLTELRQAISHGVVLSDFSGYGFLPTANEINHDLKPFFSKLLARKNALKAAGKKETIEYKFVKAMLVGTVGKFVARSKKYTTEKTGKFIHELGFDTFRRVASSKVSRSFYRHEKGRASSSWNPEWASLILGMARSAADEVIHDRNADCLFLSTDGGIWNSPPDFTENPKPLLSRMIAVGGGIHPEGSGDGSVSELWIAKNRMYCAWLNGSLVKKAQMQFNRKYFNIEDFVRKSLKKGSPIAEFYEPIRRSGFYEFDFKKIPLESDIKERKVIRFGEGFKRKLLNSNVDIYRGNCGTVPYNDVYDAFKDEYKIKERGRPKKSGRALSEKQITEILAVSKKVSHQHLADKYHVSRRTIQRVRLQKDAYKTGQKP